MQVWLVSFVVLFAAVELFQWFRQVVLPLPVAIAAGCLLVIASNLDSFPRGWLSLLRSETDAPPLPPPGTQERDPEIIP